jgi:arylsulfatase A-like enzyme
MAGGIKRRTFLEYSALSGIGALACADSETMTKDHPFPARPNVIIVMTDDQGYGEIGCHGNDLIETPHIDRFHDESVRFERFFVSPTCSPTRAALLTGRHEFRCGITHTILGRSLIHQDEVTLADVLSSSGYRTGIFGKWHLGDNYPCRPMDKGFDESLYHGGGGITQTPDYWGNTYFSPTLNHNGSWEETDGYCCDVYFDKAMSWMESGGDEPFFAYIAPNTPHSPFQVDDKYSAPYEARGLSPDAAKFYGMIANIDENMGRLVSWLGERGLEENTLVVFLTDNGSAFACQFGLFNDGMKGCKATPNEGGVRVPCYFRWPGVLTGGRDIETIAAHIDMLPTIVSICGADLPDRDLDGISIVPLLADEHADMPDRFLMTHVGRWGSGEKPSKYEPCSIRSQQFRFVNNSELFDMTADPSERVNVIDRNPDIVRRMRAAYDTWWEEVLPRIETPQRIGIGSPDENPARITCMDWRESRVAAGEPNWQQFHLWVQDFMETVARREVYQGDRERPGGAMGSWALDVKRAGRYRLTLSKLPDTADPAAAALLEGAAFIWYGDERESKAIVPGDTSVTIDIALTGGMMDLDCWFTGQRLDGVAESGAYFVDVEFLG